VSFDAILCALAKVWLRNVAQLQWNQIKRAHGRTKMKHASTVADVNPYEARDLEQSSELHGRIAPRTAKLKTVSVLAGLVLFGLTFGCSFTACMILFERFAIYFVGSSPLGAPTGTSMIRQAAGVFSVFGFLGSLPAIPFLLLINSKARLSFRISFLTLASLGTVFFLATACASSPMRPLSPLGPILKIEVTIG